MSRGARLSGSEQSSKRSWGNGLLLGVLLLSVPGTVWLSDLLDRWGSTQAGYLVLLALVLVLCGAAAATHALAGNVAERVAHRRVRDEASPALGESVVVRTAGVAALVAPLLTLPVAFSLATRWENGRTLADAASTGYLYPPMGVRDLFLMGMIAPAAGFLLGALVLGAARTGRSASQAKAAVTLSVAAGLLVLPVSQMTKRSMGTVFKSACLSNISNVTIALQMYSADNAGMFPPADRWCDALDEYVQYPELYLCPESWGTASSFAYNNALSGVRQPLPRDGTSLIAIFESNAGRNAHGGPELLVKEPRHRGGDNWGFADGHVAWVSRSDIAGGAGTTYRWSE